MDAIELYPIALVGLGTVIMMFNIYRYFTLTKQLSQLHTKAKRFPRALLSAYIVLLIFFLIGYIVVGLGFCDPSRRVSNLLVSCIFFFGSVFVFIGLILQISMSRTIQKSNLEITQVLIASIEARDANLNGHSLHVAKLVMLMYRYLPRERQRSINPADLEYAALLHDVGKLGVPEHVLNKEGSLSADEWREIRKHPQIGKNILSGLDCFEEISDWVLYHHERCDGKGYIGLLQGQIPYPSLIIAVADTYSAITMKRSYRDAKDYSHAAQALREAGGSQLDQGLVELFLSIPRREVERCMPGA